jgi:hypothetical protein
MEMEKVGVGRAKERVEGGESRERRWWWGWVSMRWNEFQ